ILQDDETNLDPFAIQVPASAKAPKITTLAHKVYRRSTGLLDLIPSNLNLMFLSLGQPPDQISRFDNRFRHLITEARGIYDIIIIDCHPAGSILTKTSLQNSDHVVIPVMASKFAGRGVGLMQTFLDAIHNSSRAPQAHVLF